MQVIMRFFLYEFVTCLSHLFDGLRETTRTNPFLSLQPLNISLLLQQNRAILVISL